MVEHDGCEGCKYERISELEEPCYKCKHAHFPDGDKYPDKYEFDPVNHPSHYCQDGGIECIDEMIAVFGVTTVMSFCLLNVWKYRKRAVFKNGEEDMKKADWYMKKWMELKET